MNLYLDCMHGNYSLKTSVNMNDLHESGELKKYFRSGRNNESLDLNVIRKITRGHLMCGNEFNILYAYAHYNFHQRSAQMPHLLKL